MRLWLINEYPSIEVLEGMMSTRPFFSILMIRLMYVPTFAKNYGLAVLDAPVGHLVAATGAGALYSCGVFCYIGSVASSLAESLSSESGDAAGAAEESAGDKALKYGPMVSALLVTVAVVVVVRRMVKKRIRQAGIEADAERWRAQEEGGGQAGAGQARSGGAGGGGAKGGGAEGDAEALEVVAEVVVLGPGDASPRRRDRANPIAAAGAPSETSGARCETTLGRLRVDTDPAPAPVEGPGGGEVWEDAGGVATADGSPRGGVSRPPAPSVDSISDI
jgi:hypothetical protein